MFCGNMLPTGSKYCNKCGRKLKTIKKQPVSHTSANTVFAWALVLFAVCSVAKTTLKAVLFGVWFTIGTLISMVCSLIIGIAAALILRKCGLIKPEKIKKGIMGFSVTTLIIEIGNVFSFFSVKKFAYWFYGESTKVAINLAEKYVGWAEDIIGANTLWLWGLFILFMLLKSESIKIKKYHSLIVLAVLIVWTVVWTIVLDNVLLNEVSRRGSNWMNYIYELTRICCNGYMIPMFFRRFVLYWFALFAGKGKIGNVRSIMFAVILPVGAYFMQPLVLSLYGIWGGFMAVSFGYLIGAIILLTGFIKKKDKKQPMLDTPQNDLLTK